jgi:hypothetical protein
MVWGRLQAVAATATSALTFFRPRIQGTDYTVFFMGPFLGLLSHYFSHFQKWDILWFPSVGQEVTF